MSKPNEHKLETTKKNRLRYLQEETDLLEMAFGDAEHQGRSHRERDVVLGHLKHGVIVAQSCQLKQVRCYKWSNTSVVSFTRLGKP